MPVLKISVQHILAQGVIVASLLYNESVIENKNLIGMANRAKEMR